MKTDRMHHVLRLAALIAAVGLAGPAQAADKAPARASGPAATEKAERSGGELDLEAILRGVPHDACFGDRYETDQDLNEGNRITDEEILRLINPLRS